MNTILFRCLKPILCLAVLAVLAACGQTNASAPTSGSLPTEAATSTATPIPTATHTASPTPIPGVQVIPVDSLGNSMPWLPMNPDKVPMSVYYGFNFGSPVFKDALVRQAFSLAVDREEIAEEARHFKFCEVAPATTLTPASILGRDLYGSVGYTFDPVKAKERLVEAGYTDVTRFPTVTLVVYTRGEASPGAYFRMAESIAEMWKTHLGVEVNVEAPGGIPAYLARLAEGNYDIYTLGWGADIMDPDNFLNILLHSGSEFNHGHYYNRAYDQIVEQAAELSDPEERQLLYIKVERILTEENSAIIPLFHTLFYKSVCR